MNTSTVTSCDRTVPSTWLCLAPCGAPIMKMVRRVEGVEGGGGSGGGERSITAGGSPTNLSTAPEQTATQLVSLYLVSN